MRGLGSAVWGVRQSLSLKVILIVQTLLQIQSRNDKPQ